MEQFILSPITLEELKTAIANILDEKIKSFIPEVVPGLEGREIYLSRSQVAQQLKISLPTLHNLTTQGYISACRVKGSRRILYKRSEVEAALPQISSTKYKRKDLGA